MIEYSSSRSSTERSIGPIELMIRMGRGSFCGFGINPVNETRLSVGFNPNTPQKCAGIRIELERSVPISKGVIPEARAAAAPPLEPPDVRCWSQGLLVGPKSGLFV